MTYRVRVDLEHAKPPIWRRLELASDLRLDEVHLVLQVAFTWEGHHLHEFSAFGRRWDHASRTYGADVDMDLGRSTVPERKASLRDVLRQVGDSLYYWYDFGDDWNHVIDLEEVTERGPNAPRARVVGGRRAAPPDDCGGIPGYERLLAVLDDPTDPEHAELSEWTTGMGLGAPGEFNPAHVDLDALDVAVQQVV